MKFCALAFLGGLAFCPLAAGQAPAPLSAAVDVLKLIPGGLAAMSGHDDLMLAYDRAGKHTAAPGPWLVLGDALAQRQRDTGDAAWYAPAEAAYATACSLDPACADAMTGLAWVHGGRHQFPQSVQWAKKALEVDDLHPGAHGIIGDAALELGDMDRAFECYQKMMDLKPDLSSYSRGAWLVWMTGDSRKGRWLMEKAISAGSPQAENTAWCRSRLALMQFHEGALLAAAQTVDQGLRQAPRHVPLLLMQGRVKTALNDDAAAVHAFEAVLALGSNHEALAGLGDLHLARGRTQEAEVFFTRVEALHADNVAKGIHDHSQMARFYASHDRNLESAVRLASEHGSSANTYDADTLAWVSLKSGDVPKARKAILSALQAGTPDAEIFFHAGMIAAAMHDTVGAKKFLSRAMSLNPRFHPLQAQVASSKLEELTGTATAQVRN